MAEFIFGNLDSSTKTNDTYNVCRFHVPETTLDEETAAGYHTHALREMHVPACCPAHSQLRPATDEPLTNLPVARLRTEPAEFIELVYEENDGEVKRHYTICRLGVPRRRMAEEVHKGLHPGYKANRVKPMGQNDRYGDAYVQAKGDMTPDNNVNRVGRPWGCGGTCRVSRVTMK